MKWIFSLLLLAIAAPAQKPKPLELEVVEIAASREDDKLTIDGKVRNISVKPIRRLVIIFEVLDSDKNVLTKQSTDSQEDVVEPGEEIEFHVQMGFHARAVQVRFSFEDASGHDLRTGPLKPIAIE